MALMVNQTQLKQNINVMRHEFFFSFWLQTGNLAMESLLSLTSRRAGEWFKEELRTLGGLDHFIETSQ